MHTFKVRLVLASLLAGTVAIAPAHANAASPSPLPNSPSFSPASLPVCPPPGPQVAQSNPPLPLDNPSASRCVYTPSTGRVHMAGLKDTDPIVLDASPTLQDAVVAAQNQSTIVKRLLPDSPKAAAPVAPTFASVNVSATTLNGIAEPVASGNRQVILATLQAQSPTLFNSIEVYNWIGLSNAGGKDGDQVGISFNNFSSRGTSECSGNNDVDYRPIVIGQITANSTFFPGICFPAYQFGNGTQTWFEVQYNTGTKNTYAWINWNNTWQLLYTATIPGLTPKNAKSNLIPTELIPAVSQQIPLLTSIADQQATLYDSAIHWWFPSYAAANVINGTSPGLCVTEPTPHTNVTVSNC